MAGVNSDPSDVVVNGNPDRFRPPPLVLCEEAGSAHEHVHKGVECADEVDISARCKVGGRPPAWEEGGGVVVHVEKGDLALVLAQDHDQGVHKLVRLERQ